MALSFEREAVVIGNTEPSVGCHIQSKCLLGGKVCRSTSKISHISSCDSCRQHQLVMYHPFAHRHTHLAPHCVGTPSYRVHHNPSAPCQVSNDAWTMSAYYSQDVCDLGISMSGAMVIICCIRSIENSMLLDLL